MGKSVGGKQKIYWSCLPRVQDKKTRQHQTQTILPGESEKVRFTNI